MPQVSVSLENLETPIFPFAYVLIFVRKSGVFNGHRYPNIEDSSWEVVYLNNGLFILLRKKLISIFYVYLCVCVFVCVPLYSEVYMFVQVGMKIYLQMDGVPRTPLGIIFRFCLGILRQGHTALELPTGLGYRTSMFQNLPVSASPDLGLRTYTNELFMHVLGMSLRSIRHIVHLLSNLFSLICTF